MEDYEKKYKEALSRANGIIGYYKEHNRGDETSIEDLEQIFPELKESEDEKTRKEILKFVTIVADSKSNKMEWIAWLEKQGEQKPTDKVEPRFKVKYAGSEYNVLEVKDIAGVTFYGIEDEPNHIDYVKAENCETISGYAIKENGSPYPTKSAVFSEQKQEWSEEDEEMAEDLIKGCVSAEKAHHFLHTSKEVSEWLKSIKDRM